MICPIVQKVLKAIGCITSLVALAGCGYHFRTSQAWPDQLRHIQIQANNIPAQARFNVLALLKAMHVRNTPNAPLALVFDYYHFRQSIPSSISSNLPVAITATASISYHIESANGTNCSAPVTLSSSFQQTEPASTTIVNNIDPDIEQRLLQNLTNQLYQRITSDNTKEQLDQGPCLSGQQNAKLVTTTHTMN